MEIPRWRVRFLVGRRQQRRGDGSRWQSIQHCCGNAPGQKTADAEIPTRRGIGCQDRPCLANRCRKPFYPPTRCRREKRMYRTDNRSRCDLFDHFLGRPTQRGDQDSCFRVPPLALSGRFPILPTQLHASLDFRHFRGFRNRFGCGWAFLLDPENARARYLMEKRRHAGDFGWGFCMERLRGRLRGFPGFQKPRRDFRQDHQGSQ